MPTAPMAGVRNSCRQLVRKRRSLYTGDFVEQLREQGIREVLTGRFGAEMQVSMVGDGPVTIVLDTDDLVKK